MFDEKKYSLALLNNIIGGPGMNSRLNVSLREKEAMYIQLNLYIPHILTPVSSAFISAQTRKRLTGA
jgi:hypothetical protein